MATMHKVKSGESLWTISKHHLGAGHLWPSIYIYNNLPDSVRKRGKRLVNPNLIHPGEIILLPPTGHGVPKPRISAPPPIAGAGGSGEIAPSNRRSASTTDNPARHVMVPDIAIRYVFPDGVLYTAETPGWRITAKISGSVTLQKTQKVPMISYSNKGFDISAKQQTKMALSQLTSGAKMSFDPAKGPSNLKLDDG